MTRERRSNLFLDSQDARARKPCIDTEAAGIRAGNGATHLAGAEEPEATVVLISPFRCRMWALHDRLESDITEESCKAELGSFQRHGQLVPVLGRRLRNDAHHDVELIYGARRLFVARHLNMPLRVELRNLDDRAAIVAMDIENRQRTDISPYERGLSYARWLSQGHFTSQANLAKALKISTAQLSRLLSLSRLPREILDAFGSPLQICEGWGAELCAAVDDARRAPAVLAKALAISQFNPRPPAAETYRLLLEVTSREPRRPPVRRREERVLAADGRTLFRIRRLRRAVALVIRSGDVAHDCIDRVEREILDALTQDARSTAAPLEGWPGVRDEDASLEGQN